MTPVRRPGASLVDALPDDHLDVPAYLLWWFDLTDAQREKWRERVGSKEIEERAWELHRQEQGENS